MKIMHIAGGGDTGGAKTHIITLLKELSKENEVLLISLRSGPFSEAAVDEGIRTVVIDKPVVGTSLFLLLRIIREFSPDVLHCHGSRANMMGAITKLFLPYPSLRRFIRITGWIICTAA